MILPLIGYAQRETMNRVLIYRFAFGESDQLLQPLLLEGTRSVS
jgi:hypothetical protein